LSDDEKALRQELAALQHELRRVMDGIERNRTRELELHCTRLRDSIALCERELRQRNRALQSPANKA
jgi:DNA polymerase sigma